VITCYLPENPPAKEFSDIVWPGECPPKTSQLHRVYKFNVIPKELVSRLLVRLHPKMEEKALWRTGLYLTSPSSNGNGEVKVLLRARLHENELEVAVRGAEVDVARQMLLIVSEDIEALSKCYAGVTWKCKDSEIFGSSADKWWKLKPTANWTSRSLVEIDLQHQAFYEDGLFSGDVELEDKLKLVVSSFGCQLSDVFRAYSVCNETSSVAFAAHLTTLKAKYHLSPSLFLSTKWQTSSESSRVSIMKEMIAEHERHLNKFPWNVTEQV